MELLDDDVLTPQVHAILEKRFNGLAVVAKNALRGIIIAQRNQNRLVQDRQTVEKERQAWVISHSAVELTVDLAAARGHTKIDKADLLALKAEGFLDFTPEEVLEACNCRDITDFQEFTGAIYQERKEREQAQEDELLERIEAGLSTGDLPKDLFRRVKETDGFFEFTGGRISKAKRLERYTRYKVAERLTPNLDNPRIGGRSKGAVGRRARIVLGFSEIGNGPSSFNSEIHKSNSALSPAMAELQIRLIASENGWQHFLYPEQRKSYLQKLKAGTDKK